LTDEKLLAVARIGAVGTNGASVNNGAGGTDLSMFSEVERLVIELADAMANTPSNISDELYARLRDKFSEEQLLQLSAQLAFENYRARLNRVFDVGSDDLYHPAARGD
jgi:alkylhydroperoxidase family enzyme